MDKFATSAATVPEPCSILGTALRPFCLGHHLLLKRLELPFAGIAMADASWEEIQVGIAICGQEWFESREQLLNGSWPRVFARWQRELEGRWWNRRRNSSATLAEAVALFRAYLADGYKRVPLWEDLNVKTGIELSAPWELVVKNKLIQNGHSEDDVMRQYLPSAWYDYYTIGELNAANRCENPANWKPYFYTRSDHQRISEMQEAGI